MKLPSLQQVMQESGRTLRRFPFVLLSAACGTIAAIILIDYEGPPSPTILWGILLAAILGISLLTSLALVAERRKWGKTPALGLQCVGVLLLAGYGAAVPLDLINAPAIHLFRFMLIGVALHFLVAFIPYSGRGEVNGFWYFNKTLFLRVLITAVFAAVLYVGLALALAALDNLFGMDVPGKRYFELWVLLVGIFATWFFLAGVPEDLDGLESSTDYPKGLKVFAQYILSPIVAVYFVILYAYLIKILFSWDWPKGWVSGLILGFATAGILSLILLHPLRERAENRWVKQASAWFVVIMIPLIVMLFLAGWRRVSEYGMTEGRYLVFLIGIWLAVMAAYFLLSRGKSIKAIPASLCFFALLAGFGPWGMFAISEESQVSRLHEFLTKNAILSEGVIKKAPRAISPDDAKQISSIISYLHDIHGYGRIQPWFSESLMQDTTAGEAKRKDPAMVTALMGVEFVRVWQSAGGGQFALMANRNRAMEVGGYDRMIRGQVFGGDRLEWTQTGVPYALRFSPDLESVTFRSLAGGNDSLRVNLRPFIDELLGRFGTAVTGDIAPEVLSASYSGNGLRLKFTFLRIQITKSGEKMRPTQYDVDVFYSEKPGE
jgi:hypothetical protein